MPNFSANFFTAAISSLLSTEAPMTATPSFPYCFCNSTNPGISGRHGGHQDAQKSRTTTLPLKSAELIVMPFTSFSFQSGAGVAAVCGSVADRVVQAQSAAKNVAALQSIQRVR